MTNTINVARVARLARLKLSPAQEQAMHHDLARILAFIDQLNEVDTTGVAPMTSVAAQTLPLRDDVVTDGQQAAAITANAPESTESFFVVPKIVG